MTAATDAPVDWEQRAKDAERDLLNLQEKIENGDCCDGQEPHHERDDDLIVAIHQLHEQAHGDSPIRVCVQMPCRHLEFEPDEARGPAPLWLPLGDHLALA